MGACGSKKALETGPVFVEEIVAEKDLNLENKACNAQKVGRIEEKPQIDEKNSENNSTVSETNLSEVQKETDIQKSSNDEDIENDKEEKNVKTIVVVEESENVDPKAEMCETSAEAIVVEITKSEETSTVTEEEIIGENIESETKDGSDSPVEIINSLELECK
eukprot:TRINITY_DN909_c0_g1_i2.p1 TRINITY_DN909_c0_g1~~TRINITY_DN909_c0_g1_i2.p1  ORF type:complete len:163 (+),score=54.53 TRINITY_DN909_c0_g1_i2:80-568(+)